jgi:hypothetical protein
LERQREVRDASYGKVGMRSFSRCFQDASDAGVRRRVPSLM